MAETRFARSGDYDIAYQVFGDGPIDVVILPGWISHCDLNWDLAEFSRFLGRFADFARTIYVDVRGVGLSDRVAGVPTLEEHAADLDAVLLAVGSERVALSGWGNSNGTCLLYAATRPERVTAMTLGAVTAKVRRESETDPWGIEPEVLDQWAAFVQSRWGEGDMLPVLAPSAAGDPRVMSWWRRYERSAATPNTAGALLRTIFEVDVRHILPAVRVPTLVLHRRDSLLMAAAGARWFAGQIPGSRYVELPGADTLPYFGDADAIVDEIQEFVTGASGSITATRVLTTVVFIDVAGSTERAEVLGDRRWADLLDAYRTQARRLIARYGGTEIDNAGDGFLVTFDGPARAVRFALATSSAVRDVGVDIRAGVHTGEVERRDGSISGIAVHVGARVAAEAEPGAVFTTTTVRELVLGSGLRFEERGPRRLKGVEGSWTLLRASE